MHSDDSLLSIMYKFYCLIGLSLIIGSGLLHAQAIQTGVISGYVVDQDSFPVAGAIITVRLDSIISQTVSTITDSEGSFRIPGLPPGIYFVEVNAQDYYQEKSALVNLRVGNVETVTIVMSMSPVPASAIDSPMGPMVFLSTMGIIETLDKHILQHIPVYNDNFISTLHLIPGVTPLDGLLAVHGSDIRSNLYLLNGFSFTDPHTGLPALTLNMDVIDSLEVATGGRSVEGGMASGAAINLISRSQATDWHGEINLFHQSDDFSNANFEDSYEPFIDKSKIFLLLGGNVVESRLWIQSNFGQRWLDYTDQVNSISPLDDKVYTFETRATISTSQSNRIMLQYLKEDQKSQSYFSPNLALWTVLEPDKNKVTGDYSRTADFVTARDVFRLSEIMELKLGASWLVVNNEIRPSSGTSAVSSIIDPENSIILQGSFLGEWRKWQSDKLQLEGGIEYYLDELAGTHNITLGFEFERSQIVSDWGFDNKIKVNFKNGNRYYRQYYVGVDGAPSDVRSEILINRFSIYGQDSWQPHSRILINFGVRYNRPQVENRFARTIDWDDISSRISLNWDMLGTGKTILQGGFSRYNEPVIGTKALPDPYSIATEFWEESVVEGGEKQWGSSYDTVVHFGYGGEERDQANLVTEAPFTDEYFIGLQHQAMDSLVVGMNILSKRFKAVTDDLENPEQPYRRYNDLELYARTRVISGFRLLGNYTWSSTRGTIDTNLEESGNLLNSQNTIPRLHNAEGYLSSDHRHTLNLALLYSPSVDLHVGAILTYRSGAPYNKLLYNPDVFAEVYEIRSAPRGTEYRLDNLFQLDVQVEKHFPIGLSKVGFILDIFNLLNNQAVTQRIEQDTAHFGEPLRRQLPRSFQFGVKFIF